MFEADTVIDKYNFSNFRSRYFVLFSDIWTVYCICSLFLQNIFVL